MAPQQTHQREAVNSQHSAPSGFRFFSGALRFRLETVVPEAVRFSDNHCDFEPSIAARDLNGDQFKTRTEHLHSCLLPRRRF